MLRTALYAVAAFLAISPLQAVYASPGYHTVTAPLPPPSSTAELGFFVDEQVPSIPLIVKSPYLQAWLPAGSKQPRLAGRWCEFWTGQSQGWTGFIRVDGHAYTFMGDPSSYGQSLAVQQFYKVQLNYWIYMYTALLKRL